MLSVFGVAYGLPPLRKNATNDPMMAKSFIGLLLVGASSTGKQLSLTAGGKVPTLTLQYQI